MADFEYTEQQAARLLAVGVATLRRWRRGGAIGHHRYPGGRIRYTLDQIADFKTACRVAPTIRPDHV